MQGDRATSINYYLYPPSRHSRGCRDPVITRHFLDSGSPLRCGRNDELSCRVNIDTNLLKMRFGYFRERAATFICLSSPIPRVFNISKGRSEFGLQKAELRQNRLNDRFITPAQDLDSIEIFMNED